MILQELYKRDLDIVNIDSSEFKDFDKTFEIITIETDSELEITDLFSLEKQIKEKLDLYNKNIILELI